MWGVRALLLSSFICGALGVSNGEDPLSDQDCALLSSQGRYTQYQVTDGRELVTTTWDSRKQLVSCSVDVDERAVRYLVTQCRGQKAAGTLSYGGFAEAKLSCQIFQHASEQPPAKETAEKEHHHRAKRGFTYPGTLWCGAGNIADTYEDLGDHRETDSCCREHDHCAHVIHPFTSNYGYRNFRWHTISLCQCDSKFKQCLREVNDTASRVVGQAFFNVIQVPCFELTYKHQCVERYWYGWCKKNGTVEVAVPKENELYDYGGKLIDQIAKVKDMDAAPTPTVELPTEKPSLRQVIKATEDLLKLMMTVSPSTSEMSKVETTTKKKKNKKERKHKKGKGLKGKKKKQSKSEDIKSPVKDIWGENVVKNVNEKQPLDPIIDFPGKEEVFNDVLNDEPVRNLDTTPYPPTMPIIRYQEVQNATSPVPQVLKPYTERPHKKNRLGRKGKRQRKKKPKAEVSENLQ
ncbi:protein PROCA1 [Discoglossus pictus]